MQVIGRYNVYHVHILIISRKHSPAEADDDVISSAGIWL